MMKATVICPTYNHGRLLHAAMRSVLRQTHQEFEVFIVGDGVTEGTREAVKEALGWDERLRFVDRPKSARHGEPYRHEVLTTLATGEFVCYLGDDDLWMPDHLAGMASALGNADVAHTRSVVIAPGGEISFHPVDWSVESWRHWTISPPWNNGVSLSQGGHSMEAYRRLPHGWRTTPAGRFSDHYMWQQFLEQPGIHATCTGGFTALALPSPLRRHMTEADRLEEARSWEERMLEPALLSEHLSASHAHALAEKAQRLLQWETHLDDQAQQMPDLVLEAKARVERHWSQVVEEKSQQVEKLKTQVARLKEERAEAKHALSTLKKAGDGIPGWLKSLNRIFRSTGKS